MKKQLKSYAIIALGAVIFALAFDWFFAANAVGMGGITGLAQAINVLFYTFPPMDSMLPQSAAAP